MTLGSNIQKIRKEEHLSQEDFAEMFHVSRQTISNWENSKSYPDLETIIKISDSFQISLDILRGKEYEKIRKDIAGNCGCICVGDRELCNLFVCIFQYQK